MTWYLQGREAEPSGLPPLEGPMPSYVETVVAGFRADRIERNVWDQLGQYRNALTAEIEATIGTAPEPSAPRRETSGNAAERRRKALLEEAGRFAAAHPDRIGHLPLDETQFEAEVRRRIERDYGDALTVLGHSPEGRVGAETLGRLGSGAADPLTIASLPFGAAAGARVGTAALVEGGINAMAEAMDIPRQREMADYLGIEAPSAAVQIATAGLLGAGLGAGMAGAARFLDYRRTTAAAQAALRGEDESAAEVAARLDAAARALDEDRAEAAAGPDFSAFDFSRGGNASPENNRVGYVFGRLLELGYEPHVAAGLVGNIMQESGAGIFTRAVGDNGAAFGMAQWNGPRRAAYLAFAQRTGRDPGDIDAQIAFLHHEMQTTESAAAARIRAARTPEEAALVASQAFWRPGIPHNSRRVAFAQSIYRQFSGGGVPRFDGTSAIPRQGDPAPTGTSRGYTGEGQVVTATGRRIEVDYEVVPLSSLVRASGDLQPRDRARAASDAWIAETAASLDPELLLPTPYADRGAPIVGPDGVIESGNGRVGAIERAYAQVPDRAEAYVARLRAAGFETEGVDRPVLVARRRSALSDAERRDFVIEGQDSGVAEMTPAEVARATARALTPSRLATANPDVPLGHASNAGFVQSVLAALPRSQRNRLFDADGALNADGARLIDNAIFARAYDAPDLVARAVETEDAGPLRALIDALREAAPAWAALRSDIEAGLVRPEYDIGPEVVDAMRTIANARQIAERFGKKVAGVIDELLDEVDLIDGAVSPLTVALTRKFQPGDRAAPAPEIAAFLKRYAAEARKAGRVGDFASVPPAAILRRLDPAAFGDLADGFARAPARAFRGQAAPAPEAAPLPENAFSEGAMSPEAEAGDAIAFDELRAAAEAATRDMPDLMLPGPDGRLIPAAEMLDDIEADRQLIAVLDACGIGGRA